MTVDLAILYTKMSPYLGNSFDILLERERDSCIKTLQLTRYNAFDFINSKKFSAIAEPFRAEGDFHDPILGNYPLCFASLYEV